MGLFEDISAFFAVLLQPYATIPASTLFIMVVALGLSLFSTMANRLLVNMKMVRSSMKEIRAFQKEMMRATKANDKQTIARLQKKQQAINKLQAKSSFEQMKVSMVTFGPFLAIWYILNGFFRNAIVATSPFVLPIVNNDHLTFFYWYFIGSFALNLPLMRLFGVRMTED